VEAETESAAPGKHPQSSAADEEAEAAEELGRRGVSVEVETELAAPGKHSPSPAADEAAEAAEELGWAVSVEAETELAAPTLLGQTGS
jgi:hypothetical protein